MPEQIQNLINRILEWWRKFTRRQQVLIVSIAAVVIVSFVILGVVITRPTMVKLIECTDGKQASSVQELLTGESISYETSEDGFTFYVEDKDMAQANILLGSNEIPTSGYGMDDVFDGSFSTTEADKQKKYQVYLEEHFAEYIETLSMVEDAKVTLSLPEEDGTLISQQQDAYASIILQLTTNSISADTSNTIAKYVATELGNDDTKNIVIMDTDGNMLFSGGDDSSTAGKASANQDIRERAKTTMEEDVKKVLESTELYDGVEVGVNLSMSFDVDKYVDYHYYVDEGMTQGYLDSESGSSSNSIGGNGGVPGTDTNDDDTTYVMEDGNITENNTNEFYKDYLPSETVTEHEEEMGKRNLDDSSIAVSCITYHIYNEDELKENGTLDEQGITFDEFVEQNSDRIEQEVPETVINAVSKTTGISIENISVSAYEIPMFQYSSASGLSLTDIIQIVLAILIFAMLGFVVFRSLRTEEEEPVEEELTIDDLIASTKEEEELEDIGYTEKSEARILIEKFVDEKPEAVAQLLRNWLNEDWG
ncbi:MAG: flagellar biosynthesis protein [Pseudobutyrivibrio sp.]|nr:flagellar biosynthesis protein [Pseudobutyrivibrio sp.]